MSPLPGGVMNAPQQASLEMERHMNPNSKTVWARVIFTFLMTGILGLSECRKITFTICMPCETLYA